MVVSLKHKFTTAKTDGADTSLVRPSNWNDDHDLTLAASKLLGRATASSGAAEEVTVGTSLSLDAASQTLRRAALTGDVTASVDSNATTIANDAVTTAKILNSNVTTAKIADLNVTTGKIADLNVTTGKLAAGAATLAKLDTTGTSGQVLTAQGSGVAPIWAAASGGGIWTHIATSTASTSSAIVFSDLSAYEMLRLSFYNVRPTTDDSRFRLTLSSDNGSTFITTSTYFSGGTTSTSFSLASGGTTMGNLVADGPASGTLIVGNFNQASKTFMMNTSIYGDTAGAIVSLVNNGGQTGATAMNAFRLSVASGGTEGTIATGTFVLEGLIQ